jgi:hypothetical protein
VGTFTAFSAPAGSADSDALRLLSATGGAPVRARRDGYGVTSPVW